MSYFADHLAWQQRVNQEFKANVHSNEIAENSNDSMRYSLYPDMINYMMVQQKAQKKTMREKVIIDEKTTLSQMQKDGASHAQMAEFNNSFYRSHRGQQSGSFGMQGVFNAGGYDYVPKQRMKSAGGNGKRIQGSSSTARLSQNNARRQSQVDAISYASRTSAVSGQRQQRLQSIQNASRYNSNKALPVKQDRFNEEIDSYSVASRKFKDEKAQSILSNKNLASFTKQRPSLKVIGTPNLRATSQAGVSQASSVQRSIFSQNSRFSQKSKTSDLRSNVSGIRVRRSFAADQHKRRIMDVVNQLNEEELEKVSEMLRVSEALENDDAHAFDRDEDDEAVRLEDDPKEVDAESQDQVDELTSSCFKLKTVTIADDAASSVSRQRSNISSKSVVVSLSNQLKEEKEARVKLERELKQLQQVSKAIHSKLVTAKDQ